MTIQIQPEASGAWRLRANLSKRAIRSPDNKLFIPSFDTGKTYTSQFIAVGVKVSNSKDNWRNGGYLSQEYQFRSSGYNNSNKAFNRTQDLIINDVSIINLPLFADGEYRLRYFPLTYFSNCQIQVWEYVGVETDLLIRDLADFLRNVSPDLLINLPEIDSKLDRLLTNFSNSELNFSSVDSKVDAILENLKTIDNKAFSAALLLEVQRLLPGNLPEHESRSPATSTIALTGSNVDINSTASVINNSSATRFT